MYLHLLHHIFVSRVVHNFIPRRLSDKLAVGCLRSLVNEVGPLLEGEAVSPDLCVLKAQPEYLLSINGVANVDSVDAEHNFVNLV